MATKKAASKKTPETTKNSPSEKKTGALSQVKRKRLADKLRWFIYGPEAVGKTILAEASGNTILIDIEGGSGHLDAQRYPFNPGEPDEFVPRTFPDFLAALKVLREEDHDFDAAVIDTTDALEQLIWSYIVERDSQPGKKQLHTIEDYGYGKGYTVALNEWEQLCRELDRLRTQRGMDIILLGHSMIKAYKNPVADDYDRFIPRLHDKAAGLLKGWVDMVGFYQFEEMVGDGMGDRKSRAKGVSTGRRLLHFRREAAYDAKRRYAVPDSIAIDLETLWTPLSEAIEQARLSSPADLVEEIQKQQKRIGDAALDDMVDKAVTDAGPDMARLAEILGRLKTKEAKAA